MIYLRINFSILNHHQCPNYSLSLSGHTVFVSQGFPFIGSGPSVQTFCVLWTFWYHCPHATCCPVSEEGSGYQSLSSVVCSPVGDISSFSGTGRMSFGSYARSFHSPELHRNVHWVGLCTSPGTTVCLGPWGEEGLSPFDLGWKQSCSVPEHHSAVSLSVPLPAYFQWHSVPFWALVVCLWWAGVCVSVGTWAFALGSYLVLPLECSYMPEQLSMDHFPQGMPFWAAFWQFWQQTKFFHCSGCDRRMTYHV